MEQIIRPTSLQQTSAWCPILLEMSVKGPLLLTFLLDLLFDPQDRKHLLVQNGSISDNNLSDIVLVSSKGFLDIQENIECRFTLKCVRGMIITYSGNIRLVV